MPANNVRLISVLLVLIGICISVISSYLLRFDFDLAEVINHQPDQAASELKAIIDAEKIRVSRVDLEKGWPYV